jgi:hypothetical protein
MIKYLLYITLLTSLISSCSFKSDKKDEKKVTTTQEIKPEDLEKLDSDGDLINDLEEENSGLDRFIANIPKLSVNFLQDYSINVNYKDESAKFSLDTKIARDNPDFKYRVGSLFLRENSLKNAAKLGRFSGVSSGKIKQEDFTWVKYPEIDEYYYFQKAREYKYWNQHEVKGSSITLENTLKLLESPIYESINQVEMSFYYYSYSQEAYVLIHTEKLDRVFHSGKREDFQITINNPPRELIEDTYFRHGEFIISEIKDFHIPGLKLKYSDLISSVKAKSIPVYKTTPYENTLNYVSVNSHGEEFISILKKLYSDKFTVQENSLSQVEQFTTNLSDYTYLHEVALEEKLGKWFIMTNKLKEHYLKHKFTNKDAITLSYLTGRELSNQAQEKIYSFQSQMKSLNSGKLIPLGNITNNSTLDISIFPNGKEGVELSSKGGRFAYRPPNCRNCTGTNWSVQADYQINSFSPFSQDWHLESIEEIRKSFDVLVNNKVLTLDELIAQNHATIQLKGDEIFKFVHITIKNFNEFEVIDSGKENVAFIKIRPISVDHAGEGLQINKMGGHNIDKVFHAGGICFQEAFKHKTKLAITSWKFEEWKKNVPWGKTDPRTGWKPEIGQKTKYWTGVDLDLISTITNNYN